MKPLGRSPRLGYEVFEVASYSNDNQNIIYDLESNFGMEIHNPLRMQCRGYIIIVNKLKPDSIDAVRCSSLISTSKKNIDVSKPKSKLLLI